MGHERGLAMHRVTGPHDVAAKCGADALMTEAHAKNWCRRAEPLHDLGGDAGFLRRAGSRGDDDVAGRELLDLVNRHLVAATHERLLAKLANVACEVVDERIAVVEHEDHLDLLSFESHGPPKGGHYMYADTTLRSVRLQPDYSFSIPPRCATSSRASSARALNAT